MSARGTVLAFDRFFEGSTLKHLLYNWSMSETGLRHPAGPVGIMCRDQGQLDAYAGRSRTLWTVDGLIINIAKYWGVVADNLLIKLPDASSFKLNGRTLSKELHAGQQLLAIKGNNLGSDVGFVHRDLQINTHTGRIMSGFIPWTEVLEPRKVFEQDLGQDLLPTKDERRYVMWSRALDGK